MIIICNDVFFGTSKYVTIIYFIDGYIYEPMYYGYKLALHLK